MDITVSPWYSWLILPLLIFFARVVDVTLGAYALPSFRAAGNILYSTIEIYAGNIPYLPT